ncbi:DUF4416 family protein [Candidatus Sumerlaeota bacterium]|nr:DUF4416 family protein [Candidatus Sumerlaeota bacterium]
MAEAKKQLPVKLFFGLLVGNEEILPAVLHRIELDFGHIELQTDFTLFNHTDYYQQEMGPRILRKFIATRELMDMEELAEIKLYTNKLERLFADPQTGNRRVNIDPGYLSLSKVVLATTKDYDHRIYLKSGIFAEVTLRYKRKFKSYEPWEWTYPDYREPFALNFFNELRHIYREQLLNQHQNINLPEE